MQLTEQDERLEKILLTQPVIDTHNDLPYLVRYKLHNEIYDKTKLPLEQGLCSHTDIPKLRKGRIGAQFWSVFIECKNPDELCNDFNVPNSAVRDTLEQIDVTKRLVDFYPDVFEMAYTHDQAVSVYKKGKIASMLGVEGLHQVDTSTAVIRQYYDLGVRYITLTHNCNNPFATAASNVAAGQKDVGLTDYGRQAIREMNRLGMLVDLSHVSKQTMHDVLDVTKAPVIFSHSSAFALSSHLRNVPDDVLVRVKENGGVVQVNFYPGFIKQDKKPDNEPVTIEDAADHIEHIAKIAGWECVGFGSDFDGIIETPVGLEDASKYPDLVKILMKRGATDEELKGLMGANVMRVWKQNELVASTITSKPEELEWADRNWNFWEGLKDADIRITKDN